MSADPKKPTQPDVNWAGEIEIQSARFTTPDQQGQYTVTLNTAVYGINFQGRCKQIVQMRNGNLRVAIEPNGKEGTIRYVIRTPPFLAEVKE